MVKKKGLLALWVEKRDMFGTCFVDAAHLVLQYKQQNISSLPSKKCFWKDDAVCHY